jgi:hypothetical protein
MVSSNELALNQRLGLLRAICEQRAYFAAGDVVSSALPRSTALERYGERGIPAPNAVIFETWGSQPIIAGMLNEPDPGAALPFVRCAAAAQQMLGERSIDLLVLLIGPDDSQGERSWSRAAAMIEDDDRICRKLIWLPGQPVTISAEQFLGRSPFARPWRGALAMTAQAGTLDQLIGDEDVLDELALRAEASEISAAEFVRAALANGIAP